MSKSAFAVPLAAFALVAAIRADSGVDWSQYAQSYNITFPGYTGSEALQNFPVLVRLSADRGFNYSECAALGDDLRFSDAAGNLIPHEIDFNKGGNPARREKIERAMRAFSAIAADKARRALQNPDASPPYGMCWDGELALAMLLTPGVPDAEVVAPLLARAVGYSDLASSGVIRASHVMAAYWRWRAGGRNGASGAAQ